MRACGHCTHANADHLSFCSQCGRWLGAPTAKLAAFSSVPDRVRAPAAYMRTMAATPRPGGLTGPATVAFTGSAATAGNKSPTGIRWAGDAIGYIYVYLRDKLDAGERRRRLADERAGAEALLTGAVTELGTTILREGIQHPDLTGLLDAIGRAHARRESAAADLTAADTLQTAEAARLTSQEEASETEWRASDRSSRDADEILRGAADDRGVAGARLGRVKDERARLAREMASGGLNQARAAHGALLSTYQTIDRLAATIADRGSQIALIEQMQAHYDQRKLLTGVGLLTSLLGATAAAIWAVLR
jgi:hypothetical protein